MCSTSFLADRLYCRALLPVSAFMDSAGDVPHSLEDLPLGEIDVAVLETTALKILTALHRLRVKIESETRRPKPPRASPYDLLPPPQRTRLTALRSLPVGHFAESPSPSYCWVLLRRMEVRLEKLRVLADVIRAKKPLIESGPNTRYDELLLGGTLQLVTRSIEVFEVVEARTMLQLCTGNV